MFYCNFIAFYDFLLKYQFYKLALHLFLIINSKFSTIFEVFYTKEINAFQAANYLATFFDIPVPSPIIKDLSSKIFEVT